MSALPTTYTKALTTEQTATLRSILASQGFEFQTKPYCLYAAVKGKLNLSVYEKGPKVVIQGKETTDFVTMVLEPQVLGKAELGYEEENHPDHYAPHLGVDESGKGDFFGPLVIAGVYVDAEVARSLTAEGIMDSKRISSDSRIATLAKVIQSTPGIAYEVITIGPSKYNQLYEKFGNLNRLLAWGHATVIENLLTKRPDCPRALSDQFADPAVLKKALKERGRGIELVQRTKAESDPAVAAASILARHAFVTWLAKKSEEMQVELLKGASEQVKVNARRLVSERGSSALRDCAKMHFRTAAEVLPD
jgi:ribonuclease HIII